MLQKYFFDFYFDFQQFQCRFFYLFSDVTSAYERGPSEDFLSTKEPKNHAVKIFEIFVRRVFDYHPRNIQPRILLILRRNREEKILTVSEERLVVR